MTRRALPYWQVSQIRTLWVCSRAENRKRTEYNIIMRCRTCDARTHVWWCSDVLAFLGAHSGHKTHLRFIRLKGHRPKAPTVAEQRRDDQHDAMTAALADGARPLKDLAVAAGVSVRQARRIAAELLDCDMIIRVDEGRNGQTALYALPESVAVE